MGETITNMGKTATEKRETKTDTRKRVFTQNDKLDFDSTVANLQLSASSW